jgi:hypothetical protein
MKQIYFLNIVVVMLLSCNYHSESGSGNIINQKRMVSSFNSISANNAFDVEIKIGSPVEVTVEADDNIMKYVLTEVKGNTLKIYLDDMENFSNAHLKAFVTMPELNSIKSSSAAEVKVLDEIKNTGKLNFDASSAGKIEAVVNAPDVNAEASSAGAIILSGKTRYYHANASSGGNINSMDLLAETTEAAASSAGTADVHASVNLNAVASSGGSINYKGGGNVKVNTSSGGSVNKKE